MATLSQLKQQYTYKTGVSSLLTANQRQTIATHLQEEEEARRNQGGFFGGIGYAFEKLGLGFLSSIEGIWDYTAGGLAKLFGADEWAEQQFANDWVNYNHADEWFNPSEGWQFVGDVAGGIGTSLPAIATVVAAGAIAVASGGTLSPVAAALISGAVAGLGAAGNATKQAYRETGELGGKEFGYGALVGITEGAVEGLSAGIGAGTGQIVKGISKSFGKEVAETVTRQTIGKAMIKGFIGEAFEEGLSEVLDPVWARLTYDPNAKNATLQEVGYAALVGGLSGAIMGGVDVSIRNVHSMSRGSTIVKEGKSSNVISMAEQLSAYENQNHTGYEQFEMVNSTLKELQTSMQKTNGEIRTAKQRMLLGVLEQANTTAAFTPFIARSAENIVNNADVIAEKLTTYGIKDAQGKPVTFTAEQIRSGVDTKNTSTFVNALKTNSVLRALAVADATGRLSMDTAKFKDATLRGQQLSTPADLNQFIENATDVERQAVGERLGISDWNTLTNEQFQQKIVEFSQNGGVEAYQQEQATVRELQNIDPATAKKMPARLNLKKDGTVRYTDGTVNIAVTKNGDTYRIYDYDSGKYSKPLTQAEANRTIREIKKAQAAAPAVTPATVESQQATDTQGTQQQTAPQNGTEQQGAVRKIAEQLNSERQQTQEIDTYARKNVSDYAKLNEPNKSIIRSVIRQGRAAGIADADVLSYARVAAHTGINVVFDKSLCAVAVNSQTGEKIYSDGYYDPETNRFVVNPETTRTHEALLLHELTHAIYRTADGKLILERGVKNMSQAEKDAIIKRYSDVGHGGAIELMDEINAHYAEGVLTNKNTIEKLVAEKPKLKDRILSFFKKSSTAYEGDTKLSKSAKSLYNRYKKLFDSFSERNRQYNAAEYRHTAPNAETRYALQEALQQLGEYDETRKRHIESREGDTISRNYGDIVEFIKTAKRLPPVKRLHIGIISDATAELVKTKTDVDIKNYDFVLASNFISHIFDSHGTQRTETPRNQKAVTYANIENIIETVIAPDDVVLASDENGTALKFIKELDGKNVALTITSTKKSTLTLKSAWIIENSEGRTPSANATASAGTSETSGRNLTTDSISENGKKVNKNGKKRYALQIGNETAQVDVEETKNLVALHNLSEEKLLKVLQLGGFPMPSIAITKAELSHTDYGDITVIFGKDTISPTDRRNKVYKRDAWTPTMPQVDVKFNTKEFQAMEDAFCDLVRGNEEYRSDIQRFFDEFHNYNGDYYVSERDYDSSYIAKKAERYAGVMAAYLSEKGVSTEPVYRDRKFMRGDFTLSEVKAVADNVGITQDNINEFVEAQAQETAEQTKEYNSLMDELKRAYIDNYTRRGVDNKSATEIADELGYNDYLRFIDAIRKVLKNSDTREYDAHATADTLHNRIADFADFEKWLFSKISETEERRGIENGADPFTASGKRRSFAQMHDEYSIQNIVRNMLRGEQHGSTFFGHNANSIAARLADEFTSIKSIKEASYLLTEISESEYDALMDKTFEMSSEIIEEIDTRSGKNGFSDSLTRREDILDMIAECATVRPLTAERILSKWNSQYQGYDLGYKFDKQTAQKVLDWFTVLKQLPTKYFEAKPRRVVEFSEIKSVLIPESASEKLKTRLTNRGVPYQVYGEGENARTDIIKTMDGIRFALPETDSDGKPLSEQQRKYFQNSKIVDESGRLLPVYHGSNEYGEITVFKKGKTGYLGGGIYLTTDKQYAKRYANKNGYEGRIYEAYLNVSNPLTVTTVDPAKEILHAIYGSDRVYNNRTANQGSAMHLITSTDINKLQAKGYDGIVWNYGGSKEISVFDGNQIKLVSNQNPTTSRDIRYALPDDDFPNRVKAAQDFRDEARQYGRRVKVNYDGSVTVYHGTSATNANNILSTGVINEQSYFTTNKSEADYYANGKHSGGVVLELHIDARNLEFAAAGAEIYAPARLERVDGVFTNKDVRRYALKDDRTPVDGMSRGQRAKFAANNTRPKVYSKIDATEIVNSIIDERLVFDDKYGSLSGKSRAQVIDTLFTSLNNTSEGYRIGVALDIADYIINNAVLTDMYDSYDDVSYSMETLSAIRRYMHKVDLSGIKGEIQYKFDKKNTVSLVWGAKQGGMAPDVIAQELQSFGINIEAINEADQFFEMLEIYEKAKNDVSKKAEKVSLTAYGSRAQIEKLRQQIARDILTAYDEKGTQSKYGKLVEKYTNQIESLTKQVRQARRINSIVNSLVDSAQYLRDIAAKRNYVGAEVFSAPELTSWLKNLGKLKYRSDLRKSGARKILLDYGKFYNTNNPLLYDADPNLTYIDNNVLDALNFIQQNADSTKPLSLEELQAAQVIMASAKHLFQNYDQMTMEGKKVRISEAATAGNAIIQKTKSRVGRGFFNNIYGVFNKIVEPRVVIKSFENYNPNGILTRAYSEITRGETAASLQYIQLVEKFDDYFNANKKYRKRLTSEYITVAGAELNVGQALSLYELSKREQAKAGLYEAGFSYIDKKGKKQTVSITESDIDALQSAFTDSDKQFIAIVEDFFNVQSKKVKTDADLQILGYTNASDDFYFPIQRDKGTIAKNITDARDLMADWANVYNFSFNKDVKTGAKNKIFVPEIWSVITRHAKQLSTYAHLTVPLKNFSQIYAKNIGDKTHVQSIRNTLNEQVWSGADAYLSKLFADIQGKATSSSVIEKLRGAYAKYQLGANLKVIVSQLTSYPTAGIELDFRSMVKGAVMKTDYAAMDKYCDYARVRNYEKGVVRAEGVIDKVGKVGDIFTKPIQWTDRAAIGKIWNACQVQIERNDGHKVGTVENMQAAGVLLEEVIRLTQPNYTNTERSALMRSDSDIVRSFTMFTSVPLKQLSRLVESVGEYKTLRQMIKSGDTNADIQSRYKKAKKRLGKTLASITVANLMYTMVAQFFKWLYAKDRKDKDGNEISFVQDFFTDFASTTIGMFPVVKDIYNYFANDYEFSNFAYDSINSILSTTKDLFEVATKAAGGEPLETSDYMKPLRNSLYAIGQVTGLPIRNINNTISGVIKRFSPATAYKYNSMFYNAQYGKDIKAALANGDTELADTIMSLMLDEDKAGNLSAGARKKIIELYEQEYEVLPRSVGDSVSYNGEKIELTAKQREKFKKVYGQANGYIERMLQNKSFAKLSADKQAKAIKQVYDAYYNKALAETLGVSSDNKLLLLSKFMGIESLSIALAGISDITSDIDKNGAPVQGSKKKKVIQYLLGLNLTDAQRLLILFMQGYKISDGEYKRLTADRAKRMVISYILSLNKATQAEKAQLAQMCGVEVKNGRIVTKSLYAAK